MKNTPLDWIDRFILDMKDRENHWFRQHEDAITKQEAIRAERMKLESLRDALAKEEAKRT